MSKTKTITITVKKGRHAEQPYTYTIDQGIGPLMTPRERFTTRRNAKRSALRKLGVWSGSVLPGFIFTDKGTKLVRFTDV